MPGLGTKSGTAFRRDILANRPVAEPSIEGFMFFATDDNGGTLYQCDGITWLPITNGLRNIVAGTGISIVNSPSTITVSSVLPIATSSTLGAVKIGSNIFIDAGAHISVPIASASILGVVRVGSGLSIDGDGILSGSSSYTLPIASATILGGVKVGTGLAIDGGGILSTTGVPAGVSVGASVSNSVDQPITNSLATFLSWDTVEWDTDSIHPVTSTRLTCHTAGYYLVWATVAWDAPTTDTQILFRVNGTQFYEGNTTVADPNSDIISTSTVIYLIPNDYVECRVYWQGPGGPISVGATSNPRSPRFGIQMITAATSGAGEWAEEVDHGGVLVAARPKINFIDGANVTLTVADNVGANRVDVTVASSGGGGGGSVSLYQTTVLADTPLGFWPLTEQGTTRGFAYADVSGNGRSVLVHEGTLTHVEGLVTGTTAPYFGDPMFDDVSDALYTTNTVGLPVNNQAYTLEGWIKPNPSDGWDDFGSGSQESWMSYGGFGGRSIASWFVTSEYPSGPFDNTLEPTGQGNLPIFPDLTYIAKLHAPLGTGTWHHVVLSDNAAGTLKLYVDGYLVQTCTTAGLHNGVVYNASNTLFLGNTGRFPSFSPVPAVHAQYVGAISHMAIYGYALTDAQVLNHFMVAKNTSTSQDLIPNVQAYYASNTTIVVASNSNVAIPLNQTHWDCGSPTPQHDNVTDNTKLVCTEDGLYSVTGRLCWLSDVYDGFFTIRIWKNNGAFTSPSPQYVAENSLYITGNPSNSIVQNVVGQVRLAAGDWVQLIASQLSGSSADRGISSSANTSLDFVHSRLNMVRIG